MTREEADEAFDCLARHARAVTPPTDAGAALALVDKAALAQLQRDAIVHYISVGPAVVNLAYRVLKAATAAFVAARFAGGDDRDRFAARLIAIDATVAGMSPAARASGLLAALAAGLDGGRQLLGGDPADVADGALAGDAAADGLAGAAGGDADRVGDLLAAAGIAYVLAQLLENPPAPAPAG